MEPKSTWLDGIEDSHLRRLLSERAARHRGGSPTNRADEAFVFLRPICTDNDCPDPPLPPHDDPCRGQLFTWQPDLAARLHYPYDCPTQASLTLLKQAVASNLSRFKLPDPEVRASCDNHIIDILIWGTRVTPGSCGDLSRDRAQILQDISDGGDFGIYLFQRGSANPGDHFDRTVTVKVTDVEGSTATASLVVTVFAAELGDTPSAKCKVKPWLKECTPGN